MVKKREVKAVSLSDGLEDHLLGSGRLVESEWTMLTNRAEATRVNVDEFVRS